MGAHPAIGAMAYLMVARTSYLVGSANGFCFTTLRITPLRMHCVQTRSLRCSPLGNSTLTFCKFGLNLRRVIPVTFVPTPPRYFALPRISTLLPTEACLPHTAH